MHPFRNLLLISLGRKGSFEKTPTPYDWKLLYNWTHRQALFGPLNDAIHSLPENQLPPEYLLKDWDEKTAKITRIYHTHEEHIAELEKLLARLGLHGCILKGTGLSHLYPNPERRICGDIDLWVAGKRDSIIKAFRQAGIPIHGIIYQECKAEVFPDTEVEVHFHPSKMYNPFLNARLQRFFKRNSPIREDVTITYPDAKFNAVFCMAHMFHHYLEGGIGMRQMMDYYYILRNLSPEDRKPVMTTLTHLGMKRFTGCVMASMWYNFGLEEEYFLCPPDKKHGKKLVNDIISMGNFGVTDKRNYHKAGESKWATFVRKNRRVLSNLRYYPCEVIWSPFTRASHFVWRMLKGYL